MRAIFFTWTVLTLSLAALTSASPLRISPDSAVAGEFGTWTLSYTVGPTGIAEGGAVRVQMPDEWHSGPRNSAVRLQHTHPTEDHYVSARSSREGVKLSVEVEHLRDDLLVKHHKPSLDGRFERYVQVIRVSILQGALREDDTLQIVYGDRSAGNRGYLAGDVVLEHGPVLLALDADASGAFYLQSHEATISIVSGPPAELLLHAPSQGVAGQPVRMLLSAVDALYNPTNTAVTVVLKARDGMVDLPPPVRIAEGDSYAYFEVTPRETGVMRIEAHSEALGFSTVSNPARISVKEPVQGLYWGELHSHTQFSWDGVGQAAFAYARNTSGLDFYAMTDHAMAPAPQGTRGLHAGNWKEYNAAVDAHNEPGRFVTLHAYECSFGRPYGHHNVYFRDRPGPLHYPSESTLPHLWAALTDGDALTIPHHTGKFPAGVRWDAQDAEKRRNFEIYSGHGLSEAFNPGHPLAFEQSVFTSTAKSLNEPSHAVDAWQRGLMLSTVAASDDHRSKPGQTQFGITAIRASTLTRNDVFQALYDRATYGTTGARILLEVALNSTPMGQVAAVNGAAHLEIAAHGTAPIAQVEALRWLPGEKGFTVIQAWTPEDDDFEGAFADSGFRAGAIYYVRLRQSELIRDQVVMAWSSPIWTQ